MIKKNKDTLNKIVVFLIICIVIAIIIIFHIKNIKLPDYCVENIKISERKISEISDKSTLSFSFITDIHINNEGNSESNLFAFSKLTNSKYIKFGVVGGDLYSSYSTEHKQGIQYINYVYNFFDKNTKRKIYYTKGNHDCNAKLEKSEYISNKEYFEIVAKDKKNDIKVNPDDMYGGYYYKDFEENNIRLCVLNSFGGEGQQYKYNEKQLKFIANEMLNFEEKYNPQNWQVLFVSHTIEVEELKKFNEIVKAYQEGGKVTINETEINYSNQGKGQVIAFISGHTHMDAYNNTNGYLNIIVQRGFNTLEEKGTENEICFSVFTIDREKKFLYETRCGRGNDREWNYIEKEDWGNLDEAV